MSGEDSNSGSVSKVSGGEAKLELPRLAKCGLQEVEPQKCLKHGNLSNQRDFAGILGSEPDQPANSSLVSPVNKDLQKTDSQVSEAYEQIHRMLGDITESIEMCHEDLSICTKQTIGMISQNKGFTKSLKKREIKHNFINIILLVGGIAFVTFSSKNSVKYLGCFMIGMGASPLKDKLLYLKSKY